MANIEFTKQALREAVLSSHNRKIDAAEEALFEATDPERLADRRLAWRANCHERLQEMVSKIEDNMLTDEELAEFSLPSRPSKAEGYGVRSLREAVQHAIDRRERMLTRVEAMSGDTIALTPKQLADYFNI